MLHLSKYFIFTSLLGSLLLVAACREEKSTPHPVIQKHERCDDKPLIIDIEGKHFSVPRDVSLNLSVGEDKGGFDHQCNVALIPNVKIATWNEKRRNGYSIQVTLGNINPESHAFYRREDAFLAKKVTGVGNNIKKFDMPGGQIFMLPKDITKTADGNPVVVKCPSDNFLSCRMAYQHTSGLAVIIRFGGNPAKPMEGITKAEEFIELYNIYDAKINEYYLESK